MMFDDIRVSPGMICALLLFASCDQDSKESEKQDLDREKENILSFLQAGNCTDDGGCLFIGLGTKACGGPQEYVVYSASLDSVQVTGMIANYNAMEEAYNKKWGIVSDCSLPPPPDSVRCLNGICVGYWNGVPH